MHRPAFAAIVLAASVAHAQPTLVRDILPGTDSSLATGFVTLDGVAYFQADDGAAGAELWRSDGTPAGTARVADLRPGPANGLPSNLTAVNGSLYFAAYTTSPATGSKLFRSDGTAAGTVLLGDTDPTQTPGPFGGGLPGNFTALDATTVVFTAPTQGLGDELWRTDGTPGGTTLVKDVHPGAESSIPVDLTPYNGNVYFAADDSVQIVDGFAIYDRELFRTDGTPGGTTRVADINPGPAPSIPIDLTPYAGQLYFRAADPTAGSELWRTDGTTTARVADINPGPGSSDLQDLTPFGGGLVFMASDGSTGAELWRVDGTAATLVKDVYAGPEGSFPLEPTVLNDALFFAADDGTTGRELWVTDGTTAGTRRAFDLVAGPELSGPGELTVVGDYLFFVTVDGAEDGTVVTSLWYTDAAATAATLVLTEPGRSFGYAIGNLTALDATTLLFTAPTGVDADGFSVDAELYRFSVPEPGAVGAVAAGALVLARRKR